MTTPDPHGAGDKTNLAYNRARNEFLKAFTRSLDEKELMALPVADRYAVLVTASLEALFSICFADLKNVSQASIRAVMMQNITVAEAIAKSRFNKEERGPEKQPARPH